MTAWPPIDAPELRARLASDDAAFHQGLLDMARAIGPREFTEELYQHALGYPWPRPATSESEVPRSTQYKRPSVTPMPMPVISRRRICM